MPIRPENKRRYPADWPAVSARIRFERADNRCECSGQCGEDHRGRCKAKNGEPHPITGSNVVLTVAHLNHTPEDVADTNLLAMCQLCHNRHDAPIRQAGIAKRRRAKMAIGELL